MDETIAQADQDHKQADPDMDDHRARALGRPLTKLLDRRLALYHELIAIEADIYQELVNTLQSQIGVMAGLFEAKLERRHDGA